MNVYLLNPVLFKRSPGVYETTLKLFWKNHHPPLRLFPPPALVFFKNRAAIDATISQIGFLFSVMVVCANPLTVREILLAAEELNMIDSGEYVFFNIELFSRYVLRVSDWTTNVSNAEQSSLETCAVV